ncbi:MAG TPA: hypothetical protein VFV96_09095 [Verrucomicrobiae bacterium]|nr:hypothetical protein [Verrucomicrobiae bacterium]
MKRTVFRLVGIAGALLAAVSTASALTADNPYVDTITNRNLFNLKAPPDPSQAPTAPPPQVPNVLLAGITTLMGGKTALLRIPRPARPPEPAKEVSVILAEGAPAEEGVQVLEINVAAGTVKISNNGTLQTLDIEKNAPKAAAAPAAAAPGAPVPGAKPVLPLPLPAPAANVAPGSVTSIGRPLRSTGALSSSGGVVGAGPSALPGQAPLTGTPQLTADEQKVLMELNRDQTRDAVISGDMPPLPPTDLTLPQDMGTPVAPVINPPTVPAAQ